MSSPGADDREVFGLIRDRRTATLARNRWSGEERVRLTILASLLVLAAACSSDPSTGEPDVGQVDARSINGTDADVVDEDPIADDIVVDTDDVLAGDTDEEVTDIVEEEDTVVADYTVADGPEDSGTDCSDEPDICVAPYTCVQGVCTLDIAGLSFVEQSYQITQPPELAHVFDFVKTFAADVAFLMMDISDEGEYWRRPTRYGSGDRIVLPDTLDVVYAWQFPVQDRFILTPVRGDNGLTGHVFESNVFQWNLKAHVVLEELRVDVTFGFVAELSQVHIEFNDDLSVGTGEFRGIITRREAENRYIGDTEFEPFRAVVCQTHPDLVPLGEDWRLADILDCNSAPMDVDLNDDGILDGYTTIVAMRVEPARILDEEED